MDKTFAASCLQSSFNIEKLKIITRDDQSGFSRLDFNRCSFIQSLPNLPDTTTLASTKFIEELNQAIQPVLKKWAEQYEDIARSELTSNC